MYKRKSEKEIEQAVSLYGNILYRTACVLLGNGHDAQDVLQEVLIRYMTKSPVFDQSSYEKAWLLRVTHNLCRDFLRFRGRHTCLDIEAQVTLAGESADREVLQEIIALPLKWKSVMLLHFVEGYQIKEVASMLGISEDAVKKRLQRGKEALKGSLQEAKKIGLKNGEVQHG